MSLGILAPSRAFGDAQFKLPRGASADAKIVTVVPQIRQINRTGHESFLFIACDGGKLLF
jgi:serine/threonine protein phosphatase PrpC